MFLNTIGEKHHQEDDFCTQRAATDSSCAVIGEGQETITPLRMWSVAMKKYKVLEECETIFNSVSAEESEKAQALRDEATAMGEAIQQLHGFWRAKKCDSNSGPSYRRKPFF